jgi:hypothetical protein
MRPSTVWGQYLITGTPEQTTAHYQDFVVEGIEHFIMQTLGPDDEESLSRVMSELGPRLRFGARR